MGNPGREACWKPGPQFIGVRTIGREAHPIFQGSTCAITLSTHKGERDPRRAVMGQGPCQSFSPSVVNPYGLNSRECFWEGQVFGLGSGGAGAVLITRKDTPDLCSCSWWNLTDPSALVLHLFIHSFVTSGPIFSFFSLSPFFRGSNGKCITV